MKAFWTSLQLTFFANLEVFEAFCGHVIGLLDTNRVGIVNGDGALCLLQQTIQMHWDQKRCWMHVGGILHSCLLCQSLLWWNCMSCGIVIWTPKWIASLARWENLQWICFWRDLVVVVGCWLAVWRHLEVTNWHHMGLVVQFVRDQGELEKRVDSCIVVATTKWLECLCVCGIYQ